MIETFFLEYLNYSILILEINLKGGRPELILVTLNLKAKYDRSVTILHKADSFLKVVKEKHCIPKDFSV